MLHRLGGLAPAVRAWDSAHGILVTEWRGERTLEEAIQAAQAVPDQTMLRSLARGLLNGVSVLEVAFDGLARRLPVEHARAEAARKRQELARECALAAETCLRLAQRWQRDLPPGWDVALRSRWEELCAYLAKAPLTLGGLDCTPRNVLVEGTELVFVDFSAIGLDWPERRLAQYAAAKGAWQKAGAFCSLLTHVDSQWYGGEAGLEAGRVDAHHALLWATALRQVLEAQATWHDPAAMALAAAWGNLEARARQALDLLCSSLVPKSPAQPVRALVRYLL